MNIVVILHQGLGDNIMALPMLKQVDDALPEGAQIHAVLSSPVEESILRLVRWRSMLVAHYLSDRRDASALMRSASLAMRLRGLHPAVLLAPHAPANLTWALFARAIGAPVSVGPKGPSSAIGFSIALAPKDDEHKVEFFARFAAAAEFAATAQPELPAIDDAQIARAALQFDMPGVGENWITIAPDTKSAKHKRWPVARFRELIARLLAEDPEQKIGLTGAPSERPLLEEIALGFDKTRCRIFAHASIPAALAVLRRSSCHISACTGAVHLPSLVGTPIVGLYGPTNPDYTGPYHANARIVRLDLACSPCYRPAFEDGCGSPLCMSEMDVERVYQAVKDMAAGKQTPLRARIRTKNSFRPSR